MTETYQAHLDSPIGVLTLVASDVGVDQASSDRQRLVVIHATNSGVIREDILRSRYWKPLLYQVRDVLVD